MKKVYSLILILFISKSYSQNSEITHFYNNFKTHSIYALPSEYDYVWTENLLDDKSTRFGLAFSGINDETNKITNSCFSYRNEDNYFKTSFKDKKKSDVFFVVKFTETTQSWISRALDYFYYITKNDTILRCDFKDGVIKKISFIEKKKKHTHKFLIDFDSQISSIEKFDNLGLIYSSIFNLNEHERTEIWYKNNKINYKIIHNYLEKEISFTELLSYEQRKSKSYFFSNNGENYYGDWNSYYVNGNKKSEGHYNENGPFGKWLYYSENGFYFSTGIRNKRGLSEGVWSFETTELGAKNNKKIKFEEGLNNFNSIKILNKLNSLK